MQREISDITELLNRSPRIRLAYVFGSLAKGTARSTSDADIAVMAESPLDAEARINLIEELAAITGRPIDLVDLSTAGEPLLGEILRQGIRLKGSNNLHAELMTRHVFETEDFMPYVERMLRERRQAWTK